MKWDTIAFSELVEFPPKVYLEKGELYDNIPMDVVNSGIKYVQEINQRVYTGGGAKFENGDTIFARITPCLENGKIAKVKGLDKSVLVQLSFLYSEQRKTYPTLTSSII